MKFTFEKSPQGKLPYSIDWSGGVDEGGPWLSDDDIIASQSWEISCADEVTPALTSVSTSHTDTVATIVVNGGTAGKIYRLKNTITTEAGFIESRTIYITIKAYLPEAP